MVIRDRIKELRRVTAGELRPNPRNWRTHPQAQQDALRGVLAEIGYADALLARECEDGTLMLIDGHLRAEVDKSQVVPVLVLDVTEEEADKLLLTIDPLAEMAEASQQKLGELLQSTSTKSEAVQALLDDLAAKHGVDLFEAGVGELQDTEPQIDRDEELREQWGTETGQLWAIPGKAGEHRLLCGDSTSEADVGRLLHRKSPFLMVTDPPYGVEYDPSWRNEAAENGLIAFAAIREGKVENDDRVEWTEAYKLFPGVVAYVWHAAGRFAADLVVNLRDAGFDIRTQIIWKKPAFAISRGHYHWQHEPCWYAVRKGSSKWCGDRSQSTVWEISNKTSKGDKTNHGTQKPIECMARPIRNHGAKGDDVYDPFLGSGTTMLAAEQLGRICYGMEISPTYCAVILQRMTDAGLEPYRKDT